MAEFDPYLAWLDISARERPVPPHRLLGLRDGPSDAEQIEAAAARVLAHLQQFAAGPRHEDCRRLIAEVSAARELLLRGSGRARGTNRSSEVSMAGPKARSMWSEQQVKPPPPVPTAMPAAASPPAAAPAPAASVPVGTPIGLPSATPEITPVGLPLGHIAESSAAPPVTPNEVEKPPSWIPAQRSGQVGQVQAASDAGAVIDPKLTAKVHRMRRGSHQQSSQVALWMAIGGICLAVLLGLLFMVLAMNR